MTCVTLLASHVTLSPLPRLLPCFCAVVLKGMQDSEKWQTKEGALQLLTALADSAPAQVAVCLPTLVPLIAERMVDAREQVRQECGCTDWC